MPCSPEELARIAGLLNENQLSAVKVRSIPIEQEPVLDDVGKALSESQMGWFAGRFRTARGMFGDLFGVRVLNPVTSASTRTNNRVAEYVKDFNEAVEPLYSVVQGYSKVKGAFFGIPEELDKELGRALENIGANGKWLVNKNIFSQQVQEAAPRVRTVLDKAYKEFGIDPDKYIQGYLPHIRERQHGLFVNAPPHTPREKALISLMSADDIRFVHDLERTGALATYEARASVAFNAYLHAAARHRILRPVLKQAEKDFVNDFFGVKFMRSKESGETYVAVRDKAGYAAWREYEHYVMGGVNARDVNTAASMNRFMQMVGLPYKTDSRGAVMFANLLGNSFYMGVLGARPGSVIRQLGQVIPSFAEFGTKRMLKGVKDTIDNYPTLQQRYQGMGVLTSHLDQLVSSVETARGVGKAVSAATDYSLKFFSAVDRFVRVATAKMAEDRFDDYLRAGNIAKLPGKRELKDEVIRHVANGDISGARAAYIMENVGMLQYNYGKANRPEVFRSAFGSLSGALLSYPLNSFELVRMMGTRAIKAEGLDDILPLMRLALASVGVVYAGSEYLNADLRSLTFMGAFPHSLAFPKTAMDTLMAGVSTVEYLTGDLHSVGETDYHKKLRWDNYRALQRDLKSVIPFAGAVQDFNKVIDEGTMLHFLALTPKADVLNELAKRKQHERYIQEHPTAGMKELGLAPLRGIGGLGQ